MDPHFSLLECSLTLYPMGRFDLPMSSRTYAYWVVLRPPNEQMASTGWHHIVFKGPPKVWLPDGADMLI